MALVLVTVSEASSHFLVHRATLYRWIKDGYIDVIDLKNKRYVVYDEVERLLMERRVK